MTEESETPDELTSIIGNIPAFDAPAAARARARWDSIAKPLGSLGLLEDAVVRIAGLTGDDKYRMDKRAVLVCCADNGVVRKGVTQIGSSVTATLARALLRGEITVCKMAAAARADVHGIDLGMCEESGLPGLTDARVADGTADMTEGPAMSWEQALSALRHGFDAVRRARKQGYKIIATGELGIGNTTTSSAVASTLLGKSPEEMTGRGAGLSTDGLRRKIAAIETAVRVNRPDPADPLDVLAKVGGFDIAGLAGIFLGCAALRVPALVDGFISSTAALVAARLRPAAARAMFASHVSAEPAARAVLDALALRPLITAGMYLGEGTGAVAALPLLDMAYAVYDGMSTFGTLAIEQYRPQE